MELRDYLEQDIDDFLDNQLSEINVSKDLKMVVRDDQAAAAMITKDYEKELFNALKSGDVVKAKQVLHDVKDEFYEYPDGSPERKQLKILLHSLYDKFKEYMEEEATLNQLEEGIDSMFQKKTVGSQSANFESQKVIQTAKTSVVPSKPITNKPLPKSLSKPVQQVVQKENPEPIVKPIIKQSAASTKVPTLSEADQKEFSRELNNFLQNKSFQEIIDELEFVLAKKAIFESKRAYANAKLEFMKLSVEEKKLYHNKLLDIHKRLLHLIKSDSKSVSRSDFKTVKPASVHKADSVDAIIVEKETFINDLIKQNDFNRAFHEYHLLRELLNKLPVESQRKYYQNAWALYKKLSSRLTNHTTINNNLLDGYEKKLAENRP